MGLAITFHLPEIAQSGRLTAFQPNAYLRITSDNMVTLWVTRSEMGQEVRTNLPDAFPIAAWRLIRRDSRAR